MSLGYDPRFAMLRDAIAARGGGLHRDASAAEQHHAAAVALVLRQATDLELLLIKRSTSENDPWSGQMALPGGRRDPDDDGLQHTALRETHEEVGLDLRAHRAPMLGRLPPLNPSTRRLPVLSISPFVYGVPAEAEARVASAEVAEVFWVPLPQLRDPATHSSVRIDLGGAFRTFPCYRVAGEPVWGLTYRILSDFLAVVPMCAR